MGASGAVLDSRQSALPSGCAGACVLPYTWRQAVSDLIRDEKTIFFDSAGGAGPLLKALPALAETLSNGALRSPRSALHRQRWVKSPAEVALLRRSCDIVSEVGPHPPLPAACSRRCSTWCQGHGLPAVSLSLLCSLVCSHLRTQWQEARLRQP